MRSLTTLLASFVFAAASLLTAAPVQANGHAPATRKPAAETATAKKTAAAPAKAAAGLAPVKLVTVKGVVLGPNDLALAGASVFPLGKPGQAVITNQDGEFGFTVPAAQVASLKLNVAYQGLGDWQVGLKDQRTNVLFVTLLPQGL